MEAASAGLASRAAELAAFGEAAEAAWPDADAIAIVAGGATEPVRAAKPPVAAAVHHIRVATANRDIAR